MQKRHRIASLWKNRQGAALIEFIIVLPLFLLLVFACAEFSRYLIINIKVQKAAYAFASMVTQYQPATKSLNAGEINLTELTTTLGGNQLVNMMAPFGSDPNEGVIVTSVRRESGKILIKWQVFTAGSFGGVQSIVNQKTPSQILDYAGFIQDQPATFDATKNPGLSPANLSTMLDRENMIVVEVFYNYKPLYTTLFGALGANFPAFNFTGITPKVIARQAVLAPRNGSLICLPGAAAGSAFLYPDCS